MTNRQLRIALFARYSDEETQNAPVDLAGLLALATGDSTLPVKLAEILTPIVASYDFGSDEPPSVRVTDAVELMNAFGWL